MTNEKETTGSFVWGSKQSYWRQWGNYIWWHSITGHYLWVAGSAEFGYEVCQGEKISGDPNLHMPFPTEAEARAFVENFKS